MTTTKRPVRVWTMQIVRSISILCLSALVFPLAAAVCLPCFLLTTVVHVLTKTRSEGHDDTHDRCALILSGAKSKALYLARLFKAEGYRVVVAESSMYKMAAASFSRKVDKFYYLPRHDRDPQGYKSAVLDIVSKHNPSLFVPIDPRTVDLDIEVISQLPNSCFPLACKPDVFEELDNKAKFMAALKKAGIRAPLTYHVTSKREAYDILKGKANNYVMKPVMYDNVARANVHPPENMNDLDQYLDDSRVSDTFPYVIQERLEGPELSSCSLVIGGEILAHTVSNCSPVHQTFNYVECPDILEWLQQFLRSYPKTVTGWLTLDFMRSPENGKYYPLECNPRLGSPFMLFHQRQGVITRLQEAVDRIRKRGESGVGQQATGDRQSPLTPEVKQNYWLLNVLWVLLTHPTNMAVWRKYVTMVLKGEESVFCVMDPLPFLALNFLQMPRLIVSNLLGGQTWNIVDYCIGTLKCV
nr:hypothetical protein BaRGS_021021 [Batillaria attramentaria]